MTDEEILNKTIEYSYALSHLIETSKKIDDGGKTEQYYIGQKVIIDWLKGVLCDKERVGLLSQVGSQTYDKARQQFTASIISRIRLELDKITPLDKNDYSFIYGMYEVLGLVMSAKDVITYAKLGQEIDTKYCKFINNEV